MNLNNLSKKISFQDNNKSLKNNNSSSTKEIFNKIPILSKKILNKKIYHLII